MIKMKSSILAGQIMDEYRRIQYYAKKRREKCKDKKCEQCKFKDICLINNKT
ncbi:MAG: hypothetical protein HFJ20_02940 [Clostridia bacterium]|nr:hypothetical protein [Clostridia bacterium]